MKDLIDREKALDCFHDWVDKYGDVHTADEMTEYQAIEALPTEKSPCALCQYNDLERDKEPCESCTMGGENNHFKAVQRWIPIKWHYCTDEDREKFGFSNDIVAVFDNEMPDDNQEILITTSHGYVAKDVCYIDEGFSLDSGWDWIDDVKAWMPLPKPYREEER